MQFTTVFTLLFTLAGIAMASDPCCNYTAGGDCITDCPDKRSLSSSSLARHILSVAKEARSITSADADAIARAIMPAQDLPAEKE